MKTTDLLKAVNDIDDAFIEEACPAEKKKRSWLMSSGPLLAFAAVMLVFLILPKTPQEGDVQITSPIQEFETLQEAEQSAGFSLALPEEFDSAEDAAYVIVSGTILEVSGTADGSPFCVRKGKGTEDISGDYNSYDEVKQVQIAGTEWTCSGNGGQIFLMTKEEDGFSYALSFEQGIRPETAASYAEQIR